MKQRLLAGIVLLLVLSTVLAGCTYEKDDGATAVAAASTIENEKAVFSSETTAKIKVPGGRTIKVTFNRPPELELSWQEMGLEKTIPQFKLRGKLKNVSQNMVGAEKIAFVLDGEEIDSWLWIHNLVLGGKLAPGEEMEFYCGRFVALPIMQSAKVLEVRLVGFERE